MRKTILSDAPDHLPIARWVPAISIALATALTAVLRLPVARIPQECDSAVYLTVGKLLTQGYPLYAYAWDHKPPLSLWVYELAVWCVGYNGMANYAVNVLFFLFGAVAIYALTRLCAGRGAGIVAVAAYTVVTHDWNLAANTPNLEALMNPFIAGGLFFLLRAPRRPPSGRDILYAGLLFGVAVAIKPAAVPQAVVPFAGLLAVSGVYRNAKRCAVLIAVFFTGLLLPLALCVVPFAVQNNLAAFYDVVVRFNSIYAASNGSGDPWQTGARLAYSLSLANLFPKAIATVGVPLLLLAGLGWWRERSFLPQLLPEEREARRGRFVVTVAAAIGTFLSIALPAKFYTHYYQLYLPLLCLGAGWGASALARAASGRAPLIRWMPALIVIGLLAVRQALYYRYTPEQCCGGSAMLRTIRLAPLIQTITEPNERIYQFNMETPLYVEANRLPASGVFYAAPAVYLRGDDAHHMEQRILTDFAQTPPAVAVVGSATRAGLPTPNHLPAVLEWVQERYTPYETFGGTLYVPRGSDTERRLQRFLATPRYRELARQAETDEPVAKK